ncbi:MAG: RnfABCDGE type electron transport complex subunit G [Clostridia bacterium]|nr:RnfABCDGE type electron transport complex subunit G [Clostridia bacterium]
MKKSIVKDTLALVAITLVAALCLALVYQITKDKIAEAQEEERMASFREVFSDAKDFEQADEAPVSAWNEKHPGPEVLQCFKALDADKNQIGLVVSAVSHNGYGGDVVLSVGVDSSGAITGVKVTSMSETSGLGANCTKPEWAAQFIGKTAETLGYVKNGNPGDSEIDAIASATVTTKAVLEAVNNGAAFARELVSGGEGR